jgi:hypothetical protein
LMRSWKLGLCVGILRAFTVFVSKWVIIAISQRKTFSMLYFVRKLVQELPLLPCVAECCRKLLRNLQNCPLSTCADRRQACHKSRLGHE